MSPGAEPSRRRRFESAYTEMAARVAPLMTEICQVPLTAYPRFIALDRRGFIDTNLAMVQRLLAPVERLRAGVPESLATGMSRRMLDRYVGELFGLMSRRVLGQYDPVLTLEDDPDVACSTQCPLPRRAEHRRDRARAVSRRHRSPTLADPARAHPRLAVRGPSLARRASGRAHAGPDARRAVQRRADAAAFTRDGAQASRTRCAASFAPSAACSRS